ncbi:MAG: hypothetical protein FJX11_20925 [Alphaproteobacteria bacterium]|nr:hypothetical protein [Alphaproteobacteria bacterium]
MSSTTKTTASGTLVVMSETALNQAISDVNAGRATAIDVQRTFELTHDVRIITADVTIGSSNGSAIQSTGYSFLNISSPHLADHRTRVTVSLRVVGNNVNYVGEGSRLIGLTGGVIGDVELTNATLEVPAGQTFETGAVRTHGSLTCGVEVLGTLDNRGPIVCGNATSFSGQSIVQNQIGTQTGDGRITGSVELRYLSYLIIPSNTNFTVGKVVVGANCQVTSDGSGGLVCRDLTASGVWEVEAAVVGVNVTNITLQPYGSYGGAVVGDSGYGSSGGMAGAIVNNGGRFDLGIAGTWSVRNYTQSAAGVLTVEVDNFQGGRTPVLDIEETALFSDGSLLIRARKYFVLPGTRSSKTRLITARHGFSGGPITSMVLFRDFPTGITPSVMLSGNDLYLVLTVP